MNEKAKRLINLLNETNGAETLDLKKADELYYLVKCVEERVEKWVADYKEKQKKGVTASDSFEPGDYVTITKDCPFKELKGVVSFSSEESMDIEVNIDYDHYEDVCDSYFRGVVNDIKKVKFVRTAPGHECRDKQFDYLEAEGDEIWKLFYGNVDGEWVVTHCKHIETGAISTGLPEGIKYFLTES